MLLKGLWLNDFVADIFFIQTSVSLGLLYRLLTDTFVTRGRSRRGFTLLELPVKPVFFRVPYISRISRA